MHRQIITSSLWMLGGNGLQQALQFVIFILLARYLDPGAFGYVALASVALDIASTAGRWGITDVILQRRKVSPLFLSHAFVLSMGLGLALVTAIVAGVGAYSHFHGFTLVSGLMLLMAPIILFQAAEMVPEAMVRKELQFKWLAVRNNAAALIGGLTTLVLAMTGMGVYALAAQRLVSLATLLIIVWFAAGKHVRLFPLRRYRRGTFAGLLYAGSHMVSSPLSAILGPRLADMIVGVVLGPVALGQIKIARRIFDFVAQLTILPLSNVAQAAFPQLVGQGDGKGGDKGDELRAVYKRVQGVCALGVLPLFAGLAMTAFLWVPLVLGEKWVPAIPLIQWISLSSIPAVVNYFQLPLLIAYRRNRLIFRQNIARIATTVGLTAVGVLVGLTFVIQLSLVQAYGFTIYNLIMIRRIAGWNVRDSLTNLFPATVATAGMGAALFAFQSVVHLESSWAQLGAMIAVGVVSYAAILFAAFRRKFLRMAGEIMGLLSRRGPAAVQAAAGSV